MVGQEYPGTHKTQMSAIEITIGTTHPAVNWAVSNALIGTLSHHVCAEGKGRLE